MSSILTNSSSMVALQTLKAVNQNLSKVEDQVSTGKKVATAADNSASWSIASTMSSDIGTYGKVSEQLTVGKSIVTTARTAAESIVSNIKDIQKLVVQADGKDTDTISKLQAQVTQLTNTIVSTAKSAQTNGVNLTKATPDSVNILASVIRDSAGALTVEKITVAGVDLEALGAAITLTNDASTMANTIDGLLDSANAAAASFGAAETRIDAQASFLSKQTNSLKSAMGGLVDADMEEASARLSALQTQQQLAVQSLSIANQAPQSLMKLFQ